MLKYIKNRTDNDKILVVICGLARICKRLSSYYLSVTAAIS